MRLIRRPLLAVAAAIPVAGLVAALAGPASAAPTGRAAPAKVTACTPDSGEFSFVSPGTTPFFLGVPNQTGPGSAALLKPAMNATTRLIHCNVSGLPRFAFQITVGGSKFFLTSRATTAGQNVTTELAAPGGPFASQLWTFAGSGPFTFQNVKTGLFLRVRNSGPRFYQTVTTGLTATAWNQSP
jgi:hypothetical protein